MFLPSHLHTGSGSDQKVPAPTGSGSATLVTGTYLLIPRYEAEALLDNKPEGSFLLRDSAQDEYIFRSASCCWLI